MNALISVYISPSVSNFRSEVEYILSYLEERLGLQTKVLTELKGEPDISYGSLDGKISIPFEFNEFITINSKDALVFNESHTLHMINEKHGPHTIHGLKSKQANLQEFTFSFDIIANIFIHLTRIEETNLSNLDRYERFQIEDSLAYQNGFHDIPITELLVESLKLNLEKIGFELLSKKEVQILPTHDVDRLRSYHQFKILLRETIGDIVRRRKGPLEAIKDFIKALFDGEPKTSFHYLVEQSRKRQLTSLFLFLCPSHNSKDANYMDDFRDDFLAMVNFLKQEKQEIGLHPGYETFNNKDEFGLQKDFLENHIGAPITKIRQHVLRWSPFTPQIQDAHDVEIDFTLAFPKGINFRSGTTHPYRAYDLRARKPLKIQLVNTPIMEFALFMDKYVSLPREEVYDAIKKCAGYYRQFGGVLPLLFHTVTVMKMKNEYEKTLDIILEETGK